MPLRSDMGLMKNDQVIMNDTRCKNEVNCVIVKSLFQVSSVVWLKNWFMLADFHLLVSVYE